MEFMTLFFIVVCLSKTIFSNDLLKAKYSKNIHVELFPIIMNHNEKSFDTNLILTEQFNTLYLSPKINLETINASLLSSDLEILNKNTSFFEDEIQATFFLKDDPNKNQVSLPFFVSRKRLINYCQLALPFTFQNDSVSLLHQYYDQKLINHLQFSIVRNDYDGTLYFGGIPQEATFNRTHSHCNVIGKNQYWDCSLRNIKIVKSGLIKEYKVVNSQIVFDANTDFLFVPSSFMDFIYEYYTSLNVILHNTTNNSYKMKQFYAAYTTLFNASMLITIDDFVYDINLESLWMCYELHCYLHFIQNPKGEMWTFNMGFYDKYNVMFDYEGKKIHFYSLEGVTPVKSNSFFSIQNTKFFVITNLVLLLGVGFAILYIVKIKRA